MNGLELSGVTVRYGGVTAVRDVALAVEPGSVLGLIGPNGAGKTSLINAVTGIVGIDAGRIRLGGKRIDGIPPHRIARAGIARTYQNIRLFGALDVRTNVAAGAFTQRKPVDEGALRAILARVDLADVDLDAAAASISYGDQRRLEIARALASEPTVILLDEPAAGMNPVETARLTSIIRTIAASGIGMLLIEHDMTLVRSACDAVVVLNFGEVIARGTPASIALDPLVIEAYLGADTAEV
jgi:ABC-type branched-subunit amino acid transport system ATPase component